LKYSRGLQALHVFQAAAESGFDGVVAAAILNIGLAGAVYGRVIRRMFEHADGAAAVRIRAYDACFVAALAAGTVALGLHQLPLLELANRSIHLLPR